MILLAQAAEQAATTSTTSETILFWIAAVVAVGAAIAVVTMHNIVHAAMMLVVNLLAIAALYLALQSGFLSIVQILVYAGAIMVLFLFVIMLLGIDRDDLLVATRRWHRVGGVLVAALLASAVLFTLGSGFLGAGARCGPQAPQERDPASVRCVGLDQAVAEADEGSVGVIAEQMFTRYTFPFEAASLLLVVATIGALVLGRRTDPVLADDTAMAASARVPSDDEAEALADAAREEPAAEHAGDEPPAGQPRRDGDAADDSPEDR